MLCRAGRFTGSSISSKMINVTPHFAHLSKKLPIFKILKTPQIITIIWVEMFITTEIMALHYIMLQIENFTFKVHLGL